MSDPTETWGTGHTILPYFINRLSKIVCILSPYTLSLNLLVHGQQCFSNPPSLITVVFHNRFCSLSLFPNFRLFFFFFFFFLSHYLFTSTVYFNPLLLIFTSILKLYFIFTGFMLMMNACFLLTLSSRYQIELV